VFAVEAAKKAKLTLTAEEAALVAKVSKMVNEIVQVDVFDKLGSEQTASADYVRPALRHTKFAQQSVKVAVAV